MFEEDGPKYVREGVKINVLRLTVEFHWQIFNLKIMFSHPQICLAFGGGGISGSRAVKKNFTNPTYDKH